MFASSSRTALHSSPIINPIQRCGQCAFSTSTASSSQKVLIEVLRPFAGRKLFDRVRVSSAYARLELVPSRKARLVPHTRGIDRNKARQPVNYKQITDKLRAEKLIASPEVAKTKASKNPLLQLVTPKRRSAAALSELERRLAALPETLTFKMRTAHDSEIMYGSITINDVIQRLGGEHELPASDIIVTWMERVDQTARMKTLDTWSALVMLREGNVPHKRINVEAVRLKTGGNAETTLKTRTNTVIPDA